jgi:hypothetical protein
MFSNGARDWDKALMRSKFTRKSRIIRVVFCLNKTCHIMVLLTSCIAEFKSSDGCWLKFTWKYNNNDNNQHLNLYINLIFYRKKIQIILLRCFSRWYFRTVLYYNGHTWTILLIQRSKVSGTTHPRCTHLRFMWLAMLRIV